MKYGTARQHRIFILTFIHFNNFFESSTRKNYMKMARISTYMDKNMLEASLTDPAIAALYGMFHPQHLAFMILYNKWRVSIGAQHGKVFTKDELDAEFRSTLLGEYDFDLQKIYAKNTEEYQTILPDGHKPMTTGTIDIRIANILVWADAMAPYPLLGALRGTIQGFYVSIFNAEGLVAGKKGGRKSASGNVETGRKVNAKNMHIMYGNFIAMYSGNNTELERYVDVEEIQQKAEKNPIVSSILKHLADKVASRTLLPDDKFTITNDGTVNLKFYLINNLGDTPAIYVTVLAGQTKTFNASELGNIAFRYIMCENDSLTTNGHYSFLFVD